ncbi:unnamed protein product, partial [Symbiodinium microadriaticum]
FVSRVLLGRSQLAEARIHFELEAQHCCRACIPAIHHIAVDVLVAVMPIILSLSLILITVIVPKAKEYYLVASGDYPAKVGLKVSGDQVTIYGLAVEHFLEDNTLWMGEGGAVYFYQNELPYDVDQANFGDKGFAGYKVAPHVRTHEAQGMGVYSYFRDFKCIVNSGFVAPSTDGVRFTNIFTRFLNGKAGIEHVLNDQGGSVMGFSDPLSRLVTSVPGPPLCPSVPPLRPPGSPFWSYFLVALASAAVGWMASMAFFRWRRGQSLCPRSYDSTESADESDYEKRKAAMVMASQAAFRIDLYLSLVEHGGNLMLPISVPDLAEDMRWDSVVRYAESSMRPGGETRAQDPRSRLSLALRCRAMARLALNLTAGITEFSSRMSLKSMFSQFGEVTSCWVPPVEARRKETAWVKFQTSAQAESGPPLDPKLGAEQRAESFHRYHHPLGRPSYSTPLLLNNSHGICLMAALASMPAASQASAHWYTVDFRLSDQDLKLPPGEYIYSQIQGPEHSFRFRLSVYPRGHGDWEAISISAYIEILPPPALAKIDWACKARFEISMLYEYLDELWNFRREGGVFIFTNKVSDQGWCNFLSLDRITREPGWLKAGGLRLQGHVELPFTDAPCRGQPLDFTQEAAFVTIRLSEGPPLLFDKRILSERSEYFREMLASKWREGQTNEVDLSMTPDIQRNSLDAVLCYLMSSRFFSGGDAMFAFAVRKLADQFCLKDLVDTVEAELVTMLSKQRVLAFLGQVFGSGGRLELACWEMVKANDCAVLRRQRDKLGQVVDENPELAKEVMKLLAARGKKRNLTRAQPKSKLEDTTAALNAVNAGQIYLDGVKVSAEWRNAPAKTQDSRDFDAKGSNLFSSRDLMGDRLRKDRERDDRGRHGHGGCQGYLRLLDSSGRALLGSSKIIDSSVRSGDCLSLHLFRVQIHESCGAFAAILGDGSVVTWGGAACGGDSSGSSAVLDQLKNVQQIQASSGTFAAVLGDGSVVTWGDAEHGGDSSAVQDQLKNFQQIQASSDAFAAVLGDGSVVTWGDAGYSGDSSAVQ